MNLPNDLNLERIAVATALQSITALAKVQPEIIYDGRLCEALTVAQCLHSQGLPHGLDSVVHRLDGQAGQVHELLGNAATVADVTGIVAKLGEFSQRRNIVRASHNASLAAEDLDSDVGKILGDFAESTSEMRHQSVRIFRPDLENPLPPPPALLTLDETLLLTRCNIGLLVASYGSGKTTVCGRILAGAINPDADSFNLYMGAPRIAYISTEGSDYDNQEVVRRVVKDADLNSLPGGIDFVHMRGGTAADRRAEAESLAADRDLLILDLCSDFVKTVNDEVEAVEVVNWALNLAQAHSLGVLGVLHDNVGAQDGRARGWLGSEWARRAQCVFGIAKDSKTDKRRLTTAYAYGKARHGSPAESWFEWNDDAHTFVSCTPAPPRRSGNAEAETLETLRMSQGDNWTHAALMTAITNGCSVKRDAAKKRIQRLKESGALVASESGTYTLAE